jgi:excisionase family DNA binding protein
MIKRLDYKSFGKMFDSKQIVTTRIAANKLRYSLNYIYELINADKLTAYKYGKRIYVTRESVEQYIKDNFDIYI